MSWQRPSVNLNARSAGVGSGSFGSSAGPPAGILSTLFARTGSSWASADVREYLAHYPGAQQNPRARKNLDFFLNRIKSSPSPNGTIDEIHQQWMGEYDLLEAHHGYIQWICPIREDGLNSQAQRLYLHEIRGIMADPKARARVIGSYELMLNFYGMRLVDRSTGLIDREESTWRDRYQHLNRSMHNYLRITRILKFLGELGQEKLKLGFLLHIVRELSEGALSDRSVGKSARDYWFPILRDAGERKLLSDVIDQLKQEEATAAAEGRAPVGLTTKRIQKVLQQAKAMREAAEQEADAEQMETDESSNGAGPASGEAAAAGGLAAGAAPASAGYVSEDEEIDSEADSPRAAAESAAAGGISRENSRDQTVAASAAGAGQAPPTAAAAAPAAASPSSSATKRKAESTSSEMADSPCSKRVATPTKEQEDQQGKINRFFAAKPTEGAN